MAQDKDSASPLESAPQAPRVQMALIHRSLGPLAKQASTDEARQTLAAVHVRTLADGRLQAEATDGATLLRVAEKDAQTRPHAADYPVVPGLPTPDGPAAFDVIVPAQSWGDAFAAAKKGRATMPILENVALAVTRDEAGAHAVLASTDLERANVSPVRLAEGYPRTDSIVAQTKAPKHSIHVDAEKLAGLLQTIAKIARPNGRDPVAMVRLDFYGPLDTFHIHAEAENTGYTLHGLVCPMRPKDEGHLPRPWQREKAAESTAEGA